MKFISINIDHFFHYLRTNIRYFTIEISCRKLFGNKMSITDILKWPPITLSAPVPLSAPDNKSPDVATLYNIDRIGSQFLFDWGDLISACMFIFTHWRNTGFTLVIFWWMFEKFCIYFITGWDIFAYNNPKVQNWGCSTFIVISITLLSMPLLNPMDLTKQKCLLFVCQSFRQIFRNGTFGFDPPEPTSLRLSAYSTYESSSSLVS